MTHGFSSTSITAPQGVKTYSKFDAWLNSIGLLFYDGEGSQNSTQTLDLQPPQSDVRNSPNEIPSALGRFFSMSDFSHGSGQTFFHRQSSDQAKYLHSEGFDTSEPGILTHLHATLLANGGALTAGSTGKSAQAQGKQFVADGTNVRVYDPITGVVATENPHALEVATTVYDLTAEGDRVFAALGANGIHVRDASGVWTHFNDAQAILVRFLKDRIIAASARDFYEITAGGVAPTSKLTLKEGWGFTDLGENGPFIYAPCNDGESLSKVQIFGLDNSLALVHKGSSWLPENDLVYSIKGYLGLVLLGCGRVNNTGGRDALLYKAVPDDSGFLPLQLIADSEGAGTLDLSVRALGTQGRNFLVGWSLGTGYPYGKREGMAVYDPALDSFVHHHSYDIGAADPDPLLSIATFEGLHVWASAKGVVYEDMSTVVSQATLITSIANWNNAGLKTWDTTDITHKKLPPTSSVSVQYTVRSPEDGEWSAAGESSIADSNGETFQHPGVQGQKFALKIVSNSTQSRNAAPSIESFSTRSNPTLENAEYRLVRTVRIFDMDRSSASRTKEQVRQNPRDVRDSIRDLVHDWCQWYEEDDPLGYTVRLVKFQELDMTTYIDADGNALTDGFILVLVMDGSRNVS